MRLVTNDPDIAFTHNAVGGIMSLGFLLLPFAPALALPAIFVIGIVKAVASTHVHGLVVLLAGVGSVLGMYTLFNAYLRAVPLRVGAGTIALYVAACYTFAAHSFPLDWAWSCAIGALFGWFGWRIGVKLAAGQYLKKIKKAEAKIAKIDARTAEIERAQ